MGCRARAPIIAPMARRNSESAEHVDARAKTEAADARMRKQTQPRTRRACRRPCEDRDKAHWGKTKPRGKERRRDKRDAKDRDGGRQGGLSGRRLREGRRSERQETTRRNVRRNTRRQTKTETPKDADARAKRHRRRQRGKDRRDKSGGLRPDADAPRREMAKPQGERRARAHRIEPQRAQMPRRSEAKAAKPAWDSNGDSAPGRNTQGNSQEKGRNMKRRSLRRRAELRRRPRDRQNRKAARGRGRKEEEGRASRNTRRDESGRDPVRRRKAAAKMVGRKAAGLAAAMEEAHMAASQRVHVKAVTRGGEAERPMP